MDQVVIERRRHGLKGWTGPERRRDCSSQCAHCTVCWIRGGECQDCYPEVVREIAVVLARELATHLAGTLPAQTSMVISRRMALALARHMAGTRLAIPALERIEQMHRACRVRHLQSMGIPIEDIASREGVHRSTVYRDLMRGSMPTCPDHSGQSEIPRP